jgi:hypothetical protein
MMTVFERQLTGFIGLVLVILLVWAYFSPETYKEKIDTAVDWGKGLFNKDTPCPNDYTPVCVNETITFSNACLSMKAGYNIYTEGACPE